MPTVDEAVEHITWAAGDSFLSNYLDEVLDEVFERAEEDCVEPDEVFEERLTLREKAEIYHQTVTLPLKTRLEEVLADFFIEEDGEIERGRKV
ncbi:MAG TPA: hypothetical protein O0X78_04270, partial [Methanocorpusculum sp.]|nr:hypothetical protein [Methanocorpusculum sp.]